MTHKRAGWWLVAACVSISACTQPDQYLQFAEPVDVTGFISLATDGEVVWTPDALEDRFGAPVSTSTQEGRTLMQYFGFELILRGDTLTHMALTESRHTAPEGIRVGYAASQVRRLFGPPLVQDAARWEYQTDGARLVITIEEDVVARLEWRLEAGGGR